MPGAQEPVAGDPPSQSPWLRAHVPDELKGLTPVEEKLISLNSCYGHVRGHITVFPNNVQELATKVLPHPLLQALDEIHISWQGAEKPAPSDLSSLLSVRRRVVERALVWLKRNNPHYAEIEIDAAEMESWGDSIHGVPSSVCDRMERNEPSGWEKARTAHVVPPTERAVDEEGRWRSRSSSPCSTKDKKPAARNVPAINEVTSSGMFALDGPPDVADVEKLQFACDAVAGVRGVATVVVSHTSGFRGGEFTDSFEASFFARTFPTLFPFGVGDQEAAAGDPVSSRSLNLQAWAEIVLRRHGGRFALHHIFAFLVFNMGVRSRNRRVSMLSVGRKNFRKVERISLIVGYGVPAIWFTINPNDITNPVKLRLAAYRTRDPDAAEEFLEGLGDAYKRARLAISDPMSSAVFFHREMKLFFDHYVKVGEDSMLADIHGEDQAAYRERIVRYIDSVFSEDLDQESFCAVQAERSVTGGIGSLLDNAAQFSAAFIEEANFCAGATQEGGKGPLPVQGAMEIRRTHSMVNRWNEAIAVGLRHNHDISFIATQRKTMALIYYVTNYATKVEDPVWKRVAAAAELLAASTGNRTRQFLMRVANRVFTERPLSQVEVVAHLLGYPAEFTDSSAWAYLNCSLLYWEVFRRWRHLREASGAAATDDTLDESVLRRPGKHATVCLDGYLSKDFTYDDESCYRRAAVQHLALFVPWESFLGEGTGEINSIWARARDAMAPRISCLVDNVQLLRRSAEDAKRDAKQWAASSGDGDPTVAHVEEGGAGEAGAESAATYQPNSIGDATRLIDVVRGAVGANQVTAKSPELMAMIQQLWRVFSGAALPPQDQVKAIKSQQRSPRSVAKGDDRFREDEVEMTMADSDETAIDAGAGMDVQFGPSTSFLAAGKVLATRLTLNKRQSIAFLIICRQLDLMQQTDGAMPASCASSSAERFIHGQSRMDWQEKDVLVIDEVSMLGARTLHAVNERLRRLRGSRQDFGGIPIVLFCGDFQQFRPVHRDNSFKAEQRHQHDKAHALWKRFTTVVMLDEQMRAAGDPELQRLLKRIRLGVQDRTDLNLLNSRNRWNLNMEASLAFRVQQRSTMRIFISEHKWKEELPTEEEAIMILNQGDDSAIPVPAVFMFVAGMPIVVNHNTHQGLKLVNGASYSAVEVIVDKAYPGHRISADMTIHFGPPAGIILESETTRYLHFCQRKRPWQRNDVSRKGLPCAAAFACTDYKVQGKTLERVALELRGHGRRRWMERWCPRNGIMLVSKVRDRDLVGNRVPEEMTAAQARLEVLSERTVEEALRWLDGDAEESRRPR
ncbi:PIF1-like helicase domain-containing protein [Hirsutella rhossiliensis]|uniref:ATP-dependent DNA helicase n=1 Tax=Hirsutella rhossiliensis TaxID=111463 RepID=A0A9P8MLD5_9HYPO|nr:PIF1-like helicase domain-containing protein [Hirsutella rhossiliensis]KAH0957265.1 PIF1-like helicase domain-containing protein [Hirsutella rhossiliensis]